MKHLRIAKVLGGFAAGLVAASCIVQSQPAAKSGPESETVAASRAAGNPDTLAETPAIEIPAGAYSCTIDRYDPFPCRVTLQADGRKRLEKLGGSQRFSGIITEQANGFAFRGTFYCPYGSCTEAVGGEFVAYDDGLYRGTLSTSKAPTTVTIQYAEYSAYGGNRYGGQLYGAYLYGGNLYGGY
jgi:hypothetical protein